MSSCWLALLVLSAAVSQPTLQDNIDTSPGIPIQVPPGDMHINQALQISTPGSGLFGQGTIVQDNPDANIIEIADTSDVRIEGITLRRAEGKEESNRHAIHIKDSAQVELRGIRVVNNRSTAGTVYFDDLAVRKLVRP